MSLSMYEASAPVFAQNLAALIKVLDKAAAFAAAKKIDPAVLLGMRLAPDMFPLSRQIQIASDFAKGAMARLAGEEPPKHPDEEKTIEDLKARLARTLEFVKSFKPAQIDGSESRSIALTVGGQPLNLSGQDYLLHFATPNFYFHYTAAYAILRHAGLEIGKRDFMGR